MTDTVILVFDTLELGGAERQGLLLARHLKSQGASVQIWGLTGEPGKLAWLADEAGIEWRALRLDWSPRLVDVHINAFELRRLGAALREQKPTVLLPYTFFSNVMCGLVWRFTGAKLCVWNQRDAGFYLDRFHPWRTAAARLTPYFIANSHAGRDALVAAFARPERVVVIHNGVTLAPPVHDRRAWRARLGVAEGTFVAAMVSNIHGNKDHATLLRAWRNVVERHPDATLVLAGRIEETGESLGRLRDELGIADRVQFLGAVDDVAGLWGAADLCVHSSLTEGLPNAVLEAMTAGVPVVGTDIPGMREALGDERFLVGIGDASALADRILAFAGDRAERSRVGRELQARAAREFDSEAMCSATVAQLAAWRH